MKEKRLGTDLSFYSKCLWPYHSLLDFAISLWGSVSICHLQPPAFQYISDIPLRDSRPLAVSLSLATSSYAFFFYVKNVDIIITCLFLSKKKKKSLPLIVRFCLDSLTHPMSAIHCGVHFFLLNGIRLVRFRVSSIRSSNKVIRILYVYFFGPYRPFLFSSCTFLEPLPAKPNEVCFIHQKKKKKKKKRGLLSRWGD